MAIFKEKVKEIKNRRRVTDAEYSLGQAMVRNNVRKANVHLSVITDVLSQTKRVDNEQIEEMKKALQAIRQADILLSSFHLYGKEV